MGHRSALERMATTNFKSTVARENASAPYLQAISGLEARKRTIEKELNDEAKAVANSSFAKQWPTLNALWPAVQWGGPVAVAALTKKRQAGSAATAPGAVLSMRTRKPACEKSRQRQTGRQH